MQTIKSTNITKTKLITSIINSKTNNFSNQIEELRKKYQAKFDNFINQIESSNRLTKKFQTESEELIALINSLIDTLKNVDYSKKQQFITNFAVINEACNKITADFEAKLEENVLLDKSYKCMKDVIEY